METTVENIIEQLQTKLKELDLNDLELSKTQVADASSFRKEKYNCTVEQNITISGELKKTQKQKMDILKEFTSQKSEELSKIGDGQTKLDCNTSCPIIIGDNFNKIENIFDFQGNEKTLEHKKGQVMLIDFWATWCGPCQNPMQHNQDMLVNNAEKWGENVQIVGLGMDEKADSLITRVEEKKWNKITHYHMKGGFKHPTASSEYCLSGIPHVALFDKEGKMIFKGHPMDVDLEKQITCLVEDKEFVQKTQKKVGDKFENIENCFDLKDDSEKTLKHDGRVLMIDFWATWCGPCQGPMQHNQDMLVNNAEKWGNKIRIVGLSMDDKTQDAKTRVEDKKWDQIEHYRLKDGFKNDVASKDYKVEGIPNIVIFGKDGKFLYQGHPSTIPLEESLTKLANDEEVDFSKKKGEAGNKNPLKDTSELFTNLKSINDEKGPLSTIDDGLKPWFICDDKTQYFIDGTHSQKITIMRRQPAPDNETAKKFNEIISDLAKGLDVKIRDV